MEHINCIYKYKKLNKTNFIVLHWIYRCTCYLKLNMCRGNRFLESPNSYLLLMIKLLYNKEYHLGLSSYRHCIFPFVSQFYTPKLLKGQTEFVISSLKNCLFCLIMVKKNHVYAVIPS